MPTIFLKLIGNPWAMAGAALALISLGASLGFAGGKLIGSGARADLATSLAACQSADAEAAKTALSEQSQTITANARRSETLTDRLDAITRRAEAQGREPREVIYRMECLADDSDIERMCQLAGDDHPDCQG